MTKSAKTKRFRITKELLHKIFTYNPDTGEFTYNGGPYAGMTAGTKDMSKRGYIRIAITVAPGIYVAHYAHRLAWIYMTGKYPKKQIDHENGIRWDNRWGNLRQASPKQNQRNYPKTVKNTTGYKGVTRCAKTGNFKARIRIDGGREHLGTFRTAEEAAAAYNAREAKSRSPFIRKEVAND